MVLKIEFPEGVYSSNKDKIKEVFKILDYKYKGAIPSADALICKWVKDKDNNIKGIFHGSGKACEFLINCPQDEIQVFKAIANQYKCNFIESYASSVKDEDLYSKAKSIVDKWWTPAVTVQYIGEPLVFYNHRKELEARAYQWFIQIEVNKIKEIST